MEEMQEMLKALDAVTDRTGVSYGEAYEALLKHDKDVIRAIIAIEKERRPKNYFGISQMVEKTKESKIHIMKDEEKIGEIPAAAGLLGVAATCLLPRFAIMGAVGSIAAMLNNVNLEITSEEKKNQKQSENTREKNDFSAHHDFVMEMANLAEQNNNSAKN